MNLSIMYLQRPCQGGCSVPQGREPPVHGQGQPELGGHADAAAGVDAEGGGVAAAERGGHEEHAVARQGPGGTEGHDGHEQGDDEGEREAYFPQL